MDKEKLGLAQYLKNHPVLSEDDAYKVKYLNVLEHFVRKFSGEDIFVKKILELYKVYFGVDEIYEYKEDKIPAFARSATGIKFIFFKFFSYRYALLMDCFFMNCFFKTNEMDNIRSELKALFKKKYHEKIDMAYDALVQGNDDIKLPMTKEQFLCWQENKKFFAKTPKTILITATMSAGKSTLLNALVGKKVSRTRNEACTSKIHYVMNKSVEDGLSYLSSEKELNLDVEAKNMMSADEIKNTDNVGVGTYFRSGILNDARLCLIDTPGVNSSMNKDHEKRVKVALKKEKYDILMYVLNAENIGTDDDKKHLEFIYKQCCAQKIIFVLNKLDRYRIGEDSITETIDTLKKELTEIGFENPVVCPISAYAAFLSKQILFGEKMEEEELDELEFFARKFNLNAYDLPKYVNNSSSIDKQYLSYGCDLPKGEKYLQVLYKSGLISLEKMIAYY